MPISRRTFLRAAGVGAAAYTIGRDRMAPPRSARW